MLVKAAVPHFLMKTILMLIVGLMLAGCGSTGNHVRNQGGASTPVQDRGDWIAVDTISLALERLTPGIRRNVSRWPVPFLWLRRRCKMTSARRHCMLRLHFRPRCFCRWCACEASYESVGNAGSIDVTTSDIPLRTDSVKRCKG